MVALAKRRSKALVLNVDEALTRAVLSVDPAGNSGWALYVEGSLRASGVVRKVECLGGHTATSPKAVLRVVQAAVTAAGESGLLLVIENQFPRQFGLQALFREVEARATWEALAYLYECPVARVSPATWQAVEGIRGPRKDRKAESKRLAGVRDDNEADAILIGRWALRQASAEADRLGKELHVQG